MSAEKYAQVRPEGPPPMTAILRLVRGARSGTSTLSAAIWSTAKRLIPRMLTGASTIWRRQRISQGFSQMNAQEVGKGLSLRIILMAPA